MAFCVLFFQAEDGIRDLVRSRGLGDVYKRQEQHPVSVEQGDDDRRPGGVTMDGADGAGDKLRLHAGHGVIRRVVAVLEEEEQVETGQADEK